MVNRRRTPLCQRLLYVLLFLFGPWVSVQADNNQSAIEVLSVSPAFSPAEKNVAKIGIQTLIEGSVSLQILEPDGNVISTIEQSDLLAAGKHEFTWDGRDLHDNIVPDEAYTIRATLVAENGDVLGISEPGSGTGGELIQDVNVSFDSNSVSYSLPSAARVLIRVGLRGGPMMRNLVRWKPSAAGKNRIPWNGFDRSEVMDMRQVSATTSMIRAYKLPDFSIITYGNASLLYADWFSELQLIPKSVPVDNQPLERGEHRIAREYYRSQFEDKEPKLDLNILSDGVVASKPYTLSKTAVLRVNADADSEWLLDESLYEVGFFVDGVFVAEEEQGYLPLSWRLDPDRFGPGEHVLTVNISGFDGRVGVGSLLFTSD